MTPADDGLSFSPGRSMTHLHKPIIRAIETEYRGYRFRSRLEARWAVFMDTVGVQYRYEPEGFDLGGVWYLPDFWLPDLKTFLEIKPTELEQHDPAHAKAEGLATGSGFRVIMLCGEPWPEQYEGFYFGDYWDYDYQWCQCVRCLAINLQFSGAANRNCECVAGDGGDSGHDLEWPAHWTSAERQWEAQFRGWRPSSHSPVLLRGYQAARGHRFDRPGGHH